MRQHLIRRQLEHDSGVFTASEAASAGYRHLGFVPAFMDFDTQRVYESRFADGRPAPFHLVDGLPDDVVVDRAPSGRVIAVKRSLISGFERNGFFYTRTAAFRAAREWPL